MKKIVSVQIQRNYSIKKDIRDITLKDIQDFDVIVHLAGLSNDPLGEFSPKLTKKLIMKQL